MGRKNISFSGPGLKRATRGSLANFYRVLSRLTAAELDALEHFRFGGRPDGGALSGTELFRNHGVTKAQEERAFGDRESSFYHKVNCGSGVIRR